MRIRDIQAGDEAHWRELWSGYLRFYESDVTNDVTNLTLARALDPNCPIIGRVAEQEGKLAGFTMSVIHPGTWTTKPICYLEDLFVDPASRSAGIGRALLQDLVDLAQERGWSRLYWHTRKNNLTARRLYDSFASADDFVRYRLIFNQG